MDCSFPVKVGNNTFPCGRCIACRINRTSEWTLRLMLEQELWDNSAFITLTYDDEHLPVDEALHKEDLQRFFKRLRKDLDLENRKIKYFACGEYGDLKKRPHYHAIVFGLGLSEHDRQLLKDNWRFCAPYLFERNMKGVGTVTPDSMRYVTGYIQKKYTGKLAEEVYQGKQPPFQLQSQGLGLRYFQNIKDKSFDDGYILDRGHKVPIPRYFKKKYDFENLEQKLKQRKTNLHRLVTLGVLSDAEALEILHDSDFPLDDNFGKELLQFQQDSLKQQDYNMRKKYAQRSSKL